MILDNNNVLFEPLNQADQFFVVPVKKTSSMSIYGQWVPHLLIDYPDVPLMQKAPEKHLLLLLPDSTLEYR